jgi:hypothetical protein
MRDLTVLLHDGTIKIEIVDPRVLEINPVSTLRLATLLAKYPSWPEIRQDPTFLRLWGLVWGDTPPPADLANANPGMQHTVGLLVGITVAIAEDRIPFIRYPEAYLHPRQALGMADLMVHISAMVHVSAGFDTRGDAEPSPDTLDNRP